MGEKIYEKSKDKNEVNQSENDTMFAELQKTTQFTTCQKTSFNKAAQCKITTCEKKVDRNMIIFCTNTFYFTSY